MKTIYISDASEEIDPITEELPTSIEDDNAQWEISNWFPKEEDLYCSKPPKN